MRAVDEYAARICRITDEHISNELEAWLRKEVRNETQPQDRLEYIENVLRTIELIDRL